MSWRKQKKLPPLKNNLANGEQSLPADEQTNREMGEMDIASSLISDCCIRLTMGFGLHFVHIDAICLFA